MKTYDFRRGVMRLLDDICRVSRWPCGSTRIRAHSRNPFRRASREDQRRGDRVAAQKRCPPPNADRTGARRHQQFPEALLPTKKQWALQHSAHREEEDRTPRTATEMRRATRAEAATPHPARADTR